MKKIVMTEPFTAVSERRATYGNLSGIAKKSRLQGNAVCLPSLSLKLFGHFVNVAIVADN